MNWKIVFDNSVLKELRKLDKPVVIRIIEFLENRLAVADNPRNLGAALQGSKLGEFWKYRVGDYRIIAKIHDAEILITVVRIGNRKEVYR
jgi:mRNA interferase RelE/StbE